MPNRSINPFVEFPVPPKFYYLWEDFDDELAREREDPRLRDREVPGRAAHANAVRQRNRCRLAAAKTDVDQPGLAAHLVAAETDHRSAGKAGDS